MMTAANENKTGPVTTLDSVVSAAHETSVSKLVDQISWTWASMVSSIVETGNLLITLKDQTEHGEWMNLCDSKLPFGDATARKIMAIARHPVLSNRSKLNDLPPRWSLLFEMVRFDEQTLEAAIRKGVIHPGMKRDDLRALRLSPRRPIGGESIPDYPETPPPEPAVEDRLHAYRVIHVMASLCNSTPDDIMAPTRLSARATLARQLTVYALSINNGWNATRVARVMGRDRTTVEHARTVIEELREDPAVDVWIDRACAVLARAQELADTSPERIAAA